MSFRTDLESGSYRRLGWNGMETLTTVLFSVDTANTLSLSDPSHFRNSFSQFWAQKCLLFNIQNIQHTVETQLVSQIQYSSQTSWLYMRCPYFRTHGFQFWILVQTLRSQFLAAHLHQTTRSDNEGLFDHWRPAIRSLLQQGPGENTKWFS